MALDFPNSPSLGGSYTSGGQTWTWDGTVWNLATTSISNVAGGLAGQVPYQTGSSSTSFVPTGPTGSVFYANGTGSPAWTTTGPTGNVLVANGSAAPTWSATPLPVYTYATPSATRPASGTAGQVIYLSDTDEHQKYISYGGSSRWMQAMPKPNRNIVINGDFSVAQRSTGSVALTTGSAYGSADRWLASQATSASGSVQQITTSLPTQATNGVTFRTGLRFGRTASATTTGIIQLSTAFETVNSIKLQSKPVTLSFWAKAGANYSSASSALTAQVWTGTGTDQAANNFGAWTSGAQPINSTATLTTSWAFYSYTGTLSATTTQVGINLAYTPVGTAGADDNVYITGVQLEVGTAPSEFEFREFGDELRRCQRYYVMIANANTLPICIASAYSTSAVYGVFTLPVSMRAAPTKDFTIGSNYFAFYTNPSTPVGISNIDISVTTTLLAEIVGNGTFTGGSSGWMRTNSASAKVALTAEI